jgi:hypothetical protein
MNNDGFGFLGAGTSDNRIAGEDLQHNRQTRTADELHVPVRMVTQSRESGGPMKQDVWEQGKHGSNHSMHEQLSEEKHRHEESMDHQVHHLERHHGRHYDSQHGHDHYKY